MQPWGPANTNHYLGPGQKHLWLWPLLKEDFLWGAGKKELACCQFEAVVQILLKVADGELVLPQSYVISPQQRMVLRLQAPSQD